MRRAGAGRPRAGAGSGRRCSGSRSTSASSRSTRSRSCGARRRCGACAAPRLTLARTRIRGSSAASAVLEDDLHRAAVGAQLRPAQRATSRPSSSTDPAVDRQQPQERAGDRGLARPRSRRSGPTPNGPGGTSRSTSWTTRAPDRRRRTARARAAAVGCVRAHWSHSGAGCAGRPRRARACSRPAGRAARRARRPVSTTSPAAHDHDAVGELADDGEVVADEQDRRAALVAHAAAAGRPPRPARSRRARSSARRRAARRRAARAPARSRTAGPGRPRPGAGSGAAARGRAARCAVPSTRPRRAARRAATPCRRSVRSNSCAEPQRRVQRGARALHDHRDPPAAHVAQLAARGSPTSSRAVERDAAASRARRRTAPARGSRAPSSTCPSRSRRPARRSRRGRARARARAPRRAARRPPRRSRMAITASPVAGRARSAGRRRAG